MALNENQPFQTVYGGDGQYMYLQGGVYYAADKTTIASADAVHGTSKEAVYGVTDPVTGGITSLMASGRDVVADLGLGGSPVAPVLLGLTGVPSGTAQRLIQSPILAGALSPYAWDVTNNSWEDAGGSYIDYTTQFGYNPNRKVTTDVSAIFQIESKYRFDAVSPYMSEFHWQFTSADGAIQRRPMTATVSHVDGACNVSSFGAYKWYTSEGSVLAQMSETGRLDLTAATTIIRKATNDVAFMSQLNAAGNAFLSLPYIDASNQLVIPGVAYFPNTAIFTGLVTGMQFGGDVQFNANTAIFGANQGTRIADGYVSFKSAGVLVWAPTIHSYDAPDTGVSRVSAGVVGIGTGAAGSVNAALQALSYKSAAPSGGTAAVWKLGVAATVSPTAPNRTLEVEIGGTTYYVHAKTTNN